MDSLMTTVIVIFSVVCIVAMIQSLGRTRPTDQPRRPPSPATWRLIDACLAKNHVLQAIKVYRKATGAGLAEAKETIEARANGRNPSVAPPQTWLDPRWREQINHALRAGHELQAIRLYRQATGADLQTAYDVIKEWNRRAP